MGEVARIYGDGVNIAARLQGLAEADGICVSAAVHDLVKGKLDIEFGYREAIRSYQEILSVYPDFLPAYLLTAVSHLALGEAEEARQAVANVHRISPDSTLSGFVERSRIFKPQNVELQALREADASRDSGTWGRRERRAARLARDGSERASPRTLPADYGVISCTKLFDRML